jgi:DNA-binding response OmpR family regulator
VAERDRNRVVLAEDDVARAAEWRELLGRIGGYEVWVTKRKGGIVKLLEETNARFLVQDLELEDGNSAELIPELRERFGKEIFILVLSGYFEDFPEYDLLAKGADAYFRKPYAPKSLLRQMDAFRSRLEGKELGEPKVRHLIVRGGLFDLRRRTCSTGRNEVVLGETQAKMLECLGSAKDVYGWRWVDLGEIVKYTWGDYDKLSLEVASGRVRKSRMRLRNALGFDIVESRGGGRAMQYRLTAEVEPVD